MSLANIFQKPSGCDGIGEIYPIQLKDWDEFEVYLSILMLNKSHMPMEDETIPLLDRLILEATKSPNILIILQQVFNLVTKSKSFQFEVMDGTYVFKDDENRLVTSENYEEIRKIVLHQNLLIEPKVFKDPMMAEWASDVLKARNKDSANVTLEDMITTVAALSGKDYEKLEVYSIYQLKSEFYRWSQIKQYETSAHLLGNPYAASEVKLSHFAEYLDLYADPYKDVFKSNKGMNISQAFK